MPYANLKNRTSPPSINNDSPVMNGASSEARNATAAATSSGLPARPNGASLSAARLADPISSPVIDAISRSMKSHIGVDVTCPGQYARSEEHTSELQSPY